MKRRNFLASLAALIAAPFVVKKAKGYQVACDPVLNPGEADRHSVRFESINTGRGNELMDRYINGEAWDAHKWELAKWRAWNDRMADIAESDIFGAP